MTADQILSFMAFFTATVGCASLISCAIDRRVRTWQTAGAKSGSDVIEID